MNDDMKFAVNRFFRTLDYHTKRYLDAVYSDDPNAEHELTKRAADHIWNCGWNLCRDEYRPSPFLLHVLNSYDVTQDPATLFELIEEMASELESENPAQYRQVGGGWFFVPENDEKDPINWYGHELTDKEGRVYGWTFNINHFKTNWEIKDEEYALDRLDEARHDAFDACKAARLAAVGADCEKQTAQECLNWVKNSQREDLRAVWAETAHKAAEAAKCCAERAAAAAADADEAERRAIENAAAATDFAQSKTIEGVAIEHAAAARAHAAAAADAAAAVYNEYAAAAITAERSENDSVKADRDAVVADAIARQGYRHACAALDNLRAAIDAGDDDGVKGWLTSAGASASAAASAAVDASLAYNAAVVASALAQDAASRNPELSDYAARAAEYAESAKFSADDAREAAAGARQAQKTAARIAAEYATAGASNAAPAGDDDLIFSCSKDTAAVLFGDSDQLPPPPQVITINPQEIRDAAAVSAVAFDPLPLPAPAEPPALP